MTWRRAFRPWLPSPPSSAGQIPGRLQRGPGVRQLQSQRPPRHRPHLYGGKCGPGCPACGGAGSPAAGVVWPVKVRQSGPPVLRKRLSRWSAAKTDSPPRAERSWRLAGKPTHRNRPTNRRAAGCRTAYRRGRTFPWRTCLSRKARPRPRNTLPRIPCWRRWRQPGPKDMPEDAERRGLGTPATRASILEKLVSTGFVERKKAKKTVNLLPTQIGVSLVTVLRNSSSPQLTAEVGTPAQGD